VPAVGWAHAPESVRRPVWRRAVAAPWPVPLPPAPRFLVHQARHHLGNALWLTPLLGEIGRRWPAARCVVVGSPAAEPVLAVHPRCDRFVAFAEGAGAAARRRVAAALDDEPCDAALFAFARRPQARWLLAAAAERGARWRVDLEYRDPDLDSRVVLPPATHEAWLLWGSLASPHFLLHALDPLLPPGAPPPARRRVEYAPPAEAVARAAERRAAWGFGTAPYAVLAPGGHSSPRWPAERFAALARGLADERGLHVAVEGAPDERPLLAAVAAAAGAVRRRVVAAADPVPVLAALLAEARLLVGNDSAPIHLAEAVGTPTLYLARGEKRLHSHPAGAAAWALWDAAANDLAAITAAQALAAVDAMADGGLVDLGAPAPLPPARGGCTLLMK
jgi:ADP-heptose:LPS heptosyltransferase